MKVLDAEAKLLTNDELRTVLQEEVTATQQEGHVSASIVQVHQYLEDHGATASRERIEGFVEAVKPLSLLKSELLQLINHKPATEVELYLIVEECEERLTKPGMRDLLGLVQTHLR